MWCNWSERAKWILFLSTAFFVFCCSSLSSVQSIDMLWCGFRWVTNKIAHLGYSVSSSDARIPNAVYNLPIPFISSISIHFFKTYSQLQQTLSGLIGFSDELSVAMENQFSIEVNIFVIGLMQLLLWNLKFNFGTWTANCWQNDCRRKKKYSIYHRTCMQNSTNQKIFVLVFLLSFLFYYWFFCVAHLYR